jgi:ubiquinone/menaquinone biosynthesis C-methylase UbiE
VIEHFFDNGKRRLIKEMLRMVKPGGKVIIMVPNAWCVPFRIGQAWQRLKGTWKFGYEDDMSPRRIKLMCRKLGLQSVQVYSFNKAVGVAWLPRYGCRVANALGYNTLEKHAEKSCIGFVTIAIIQK